MEIKTGEIIVLDFNEVKNEKNITVDYRRDYRFRGKR